MSGAITAFSVIAAVSFAAATLETFAIVAAVGAVIGAVGVVTNSKELKIAGAVVGAIGAVGGLASSAGMFSEAGIFGSSGGSAGGAAGGIDAEIAGWSQYGASVAAPSIDAEIASWSQLGTPSGGGMLEGAPTLSSASPSVNTQYDVVDMVNGTTTVPGTEAATPGLETANAVSPDVTPVAATDTSVIPQGAEPPGMNSPGDVARTAGRPDDVTQIAEAPGAGGTVNDPGGTNTGSPVDPLATPATGKNAPLLGSTVSDPGGTNGPWNTVSDPGGTNAAWTGKPDTGSTFKDILGFLKDNKGLVSGVVQAGGSFLAGATNGLTPAQIAYLNSQAEANRTAANLSNQQMQLLQRQQANMAAPIPVASRMPTGLINTPKLAPVTGQVA